MVLQKKGGQRAVIDVEVRLYASLRKYNPRALEVGEPMRLHIEEGTTLCQVYERLEIPVDEVKRAFVNGIIRDHEYRLSDGDRVAIFPPIGGG
jgi:molybdopterin converting factor small subunit